MATGTYEPWATVEDLGTLPEGVDETLATAALQAASDVLYHFTRRKYPGVKTDTIRPGCGHRPGAGCRCNLTAVRLPFPPIVEVAAVTIDGTELDPAEYSLNGAELVRMADSDGRRRSWPCAQDLTVPAGEPGTWTVKYSHGRQPPVGGVQACIALARELAIGWAANAQTSARCRLPRRVTTVSRQGVTLAVLDPLTLFADGLTGLSEVDLWVSSDRYGSDRRVGGVIDVAGRVAPRWQRAGRGIRRHRWG